MLDMSYYEKLVLANKDKNGWNDMADLIDEQIKIIRAAEQKIEGIINDFDND